jgi:hypothetical protein
LEPQIAGTGDRHRIGQIHRCHYGAIGNDRPAAESHRSTGNGRRRGDR